MSAQEKPKRMIRIARADKAIEPNERTRSVETLEGRASQELVVAFMGAVGCGLPRIVTELENRLVIKGYKVIRIKLSDFIKEQIGNKAVSIPEEESSNRYLSSQTGGNALRKAHGVEVLAQYAIGQIARHRITIDKDLAELDSDPPPVAYLIDQIKHPEEVMLFRMVYRNLFYLLGVMSTQDHRRSRLKDEGYTEQKIDEIINRDRKESAAHGQQLEKAFKLADYFMHHPQNTDLIPEQVQRFVELLHGHNGITPTKHEHAMYVAHSTALKSSCMSRQVGAVITDESDRIIAVGTNDVPRYGGGLYSVENGNGDDRCFKHRRVCENATQKIRKKQKIHDGISQQLDSIFSDKKTRADVAEKIDELVELAYSQSGIPDLIEFSRAVHAEMDALISLSRGGGGSTVAGNLYTTTFPCHNCARHIVAAGIEKVYYIEPYEKSLALDAHDDSIVVLDHDEDSDTLKEIGKVKFIHFSGVGPRLYSHLFLRGDSRKSDDGQWIEYTTLNKRPASRIIKEYIDSYRSFEAKIASLFTEEFPPPGSQQLPDSVK